MRLGGERLFVVSDPASGGGPRQCIGESFAWMELVLLIATIAQRWEFTLAPGHEVVPHAAVTLRPKFGMKMIARCRD